MSKHCKHCAAHFEGDGAEEALAQHAEGFHPPLPPGSPPALATAPALGKGGDREARTAIGDLLALHNDLVGRVTSLEDAVGDLRLADEALASHSGEGTQGGEATPADDPAAPATGEAGTPPGK